MLFFFFNDTVVDTSSVQEKKNHIYARARSHQPSMALLSLNFTSQREVSSTRLRNNGGSERVLDVRVSSDHRHPTSQANTTNRHRLLCPESSANTTL